jgi:cell wall-associated NlpC family hydrolase
MRFGRSFLTVLLALAVPATAAAEPAALPNVEVEPEPLSLEAEHAALTLEGAEEEAPTATRRPRRRPRVVSIALRYLGIPYRWGGASPAGFDCSGFVMYVYGRLGLALPHNGAQLWGVGRFVPRNHLAAGDVVFFNGLGHVGIYIGRGRFVHSPQSGDVVKISRLSEGWYSSTYVGARRYR